jgi:hypothetical protein
MNVLPTPRQILKDLLQGVPPPRPLFLPIVFSLGAKVENIPLRAFLANPTKISNSLRQIRTYLRSDGAACYFNPLLEAEALGGIPQWPPENKSTGQSDVPPPHPSPALQWPHRAERGELPEGLRSPEDAAKCAGVTVAVEVIRRLKSLLRDEPLLLAGVSGPFTLAARLMQWEETATIRREDFSDAALDLAAATITQISSKLVEAGANVIFIQEEILPALSAGECQAWAESLAPTINIIRFYDALPVLLIANTNSFAQNSQSISQQDWNCIVCPALDESRATEGPDFFRGKSQNAGCALPLDLFQIGHTAPEKVVQFLHTMISGLRPALITTARDVPAATDIKLLGRVWEEVHR